MVRGEQVNNVELSSAFQWGLETGEKFERERIIELLESLDTEQWCGTNLQIIDLINGKEK
jgi:hypothetical protein